MCVMMYNLLFIVYCLLFVVCCLLLLQINKIPFSVCVDDKMKAIVVCVRGTLSIKVSSLYQTVC